MSGLQMPLEALLPTSGLLPWWERGLLAIIAAEVVFALLWPTGFTLVCIPDPARNFSDYEWTAASAYCDAALRLSEYGDGHYYLISAFVTALALLLLRLLFASWYNSQATIFQAAQQSSMAFSFSLGAQNFLRLFPGGDDQIGVDIWALPRYEQHPITHENGVSHLPKRNPPSFADRVDLQAQDLGLLEVFLQSVLMCRKGFSQNAIHIIALTYCTLGVVHLVLMGWYLDLMSQDELVTCTFDNVYASTSDAILCERVQQSLSKWVTLFLLAIAAILSFSGSFLLEIRFQLTFKNRRIQSWKFWYRLWATMVKIALFYDIDKRRDLLESDSEGSVVLIEHRSHRLDLTRESWFLRKHYCNIARQLNRYLNISTLDLDAIGDASKRIHSRWGRFERHKNFLRHYLVFLCGDGSNLILTNFVAHAICAFEKLQDAAICSSQQRIACPLSDENAPQLQSATFSLDKPDASPLFPAERALFHLLHGSQNALNDMALRRPEHLADANGFGLEPLRTALIRRAATGRSGATSSSV